MLFSAHNPEELKDFDHFVQFSEGSMPYSDYVWIYGPLSPMVYGSFLKLVPHCLLSVRCLSLVFWCFAVVVLFRLLSIFIADPKKIFWSLVAATSCIGYPSYNHNHVLVALFLLVTAYYWVLFSQRQSVRYICYAFLFSVLSFLVRPILTGYGALFLSTLILLCLNLSWKEKAKLMGFGLSFLGVGLGFFYAFYGASMKYGFLPLPWTILMPKAYPSLHYLLPTHWFIHSEWLPFFRAVRTSLETFIFYLHFFIWPTVIITLFLTRKHDLYLRASVVCALFALMGSLDVLHYGFHRPDLELAMTVRGQFFFVLTFVSILLALTHPIPLRWEKRFGFGVILLLVCWGYYPMAARVSQMARFEVNTYNVPVLRAVFTDPKRDGLLEAAKYIAEHCNKNESAVFMDYLPGVRHLVPCRDVFEKDVFAFTRMPWYEFKKGENPYVPEGKISSGDFIRERMDASHSEFIVTTRAVPNFLEGYCEAPEWETKIFESFPINLTVCHRVAKVSH